MLRMNRRRRAAEGRGVDAGHGTYTSREIEVNLAGWKGTEVVGERGGWARWSRKNRYRKSSWRRWGMDEW